MSTIEQTSTDNQTVALGLSGGVDSAVSAYLLKQQGFDVSAVYLKCWEQEGCRAEQDRQDALRVALQLNIPFQVLDFKQTYQEQVMGYFLSEYKAGRTPNPDVLCNSVIKFGMFYDWAAANNFQAVATGHYAQIIKDETNNFHLAVSKDLHKDQTYFLHQLKKKQLPQIVFPIGHLQKKEVRQLARETNLPVAEKKDSVGICFVGEINVAKYLKKQLGEKPGKIVTSSGKVVGEHQGLWFYTIGQRHGFSVNINKVKESTNWHHSEKGLPPLFVIDKIPEKNQLVVGLKKQTVASQFSIKNFHQIDQSLSLKKLPLKVRIRHTGKLLDCFVEKKQGLLMVNTKQSVEGLASGQFAVFYTNSNNLGNHQPWAQYICLGGGVIETSKNNTNN